jgi:hypothetical protein
MEKGAMKPLEIIDENGNIHGPFVTAADAMAYAESRGLGDQRDPDADDERGWCHSCGKAGDGG